MAFLCLSKYHLFPSKYAILSKICLECNKLFKDNLETSISFPYHNGLVAEACYHSCDYFNTNYCFANRMQIIISVQEEQDLKLVTFSLVTDPYPRASKKSFLLLKMHGLSVEGRFLNTTLSFILAL